ncbi:MAG: hypothetical protein WC554_17545 [Clostridia bacterium]
MAELTSSQNISRNPRTSSDWIYVLIERSVINILKRFRFLEIGTVENLDTENYAVRCKLLGRKDTKTGEPRLTKWLKVYSIFASEDEGICAMPNRGDYGLVMFRHADESGGLFFGLHFGAKKTVPVKKRGTVTESLHPKDVLIKRNGSWMLIVGKEEHRGDIELWHKDENFALISRGYEKFFMKDGLQVDIQRWSNQHSPGYEYKTMEWIRKKSDYVSTTQVYGYLYDMIIRRRRITITPPKMATDATADLPRDPLSNSTTKLDARVEQTHICDFKRKVHDELVQKSLIQGDPDKSHLLFTMHKHEYPKTAGPGKDLTNMSVQQDEDEAIHTYVDANLDFKHNSHAIIKTYVDKNSSYITLFSNFKANFQYFTVYTSEGVSRIDTLGGADEEMVKFKQIYDTFAYEMDEFDKLDNTDDLVVDDIEQRGITGIPQVGGEYTDDDVANYWTKFYDKLKGGKETTTPNDCVAAIGNWIDSGAQKATIEEITISESEELLSI